MKSLLLKITSSMKYSQTSSNKSYSFLTTVYARKIKLHPKISFTKFHPRITRNN